MLTGFTAPLNTESLRLIARAFGDPEWFQRIPPGHYEELLALVTDAAKNGHRERIRQHAIRTLSVIIERQRLLEADPVGGRTLRIARPRIAGGFSVSGRRDPICRDGLDFEGS